MIKNVDQKTWDEKQKDIAERGIDGPDGLKYLNMGDGKYEAYRVKADGTLEKIVPNEKVVDQLHEWDLNKGIDARPKERNMDYRWDHKRALAQARKNKTRIPRLAPFTPIADTSYTDQIYYNPDQAIGAVKSMVNTQGTKQAMFAPQQQQTANFLAGQQFDMMGKIISQYEDKNVAAHNRESLTNTGIANRSSERLAKAIEGHHDKTTVLQQEFSNARTIADNNIAENEIAMWDERRKRLNLEATIGEQYATDPNTGLHNFQRGKDYGPQNEGTDKTVAMVDKLKKMYPSMDDREIVKVAQLALNGKYEVTEEPYNRDNYND